MIINKLPLCSAVGHVSEQTCRPIFATGHGQHHGHPQGEAVRRGERRPVAVGLRGSAAKTGQGRGAQGTKTAIRRVRTAIRGRYTSDCIPYT